MLKIAIDELAILNFCLVFNDFKTQKRVQGGGLRGVGINHR